MESILSKNYSEILCMIADELNTRRVNWVLSGSSNLRLQGIHAKETDIDIITDKVGAQVFEEIFVDFMLKPVLYSETDSVRSYYGIFEIEGIKVEVMGDNEVYDTQYKKWIGTVDPYKIFHKNLGTSVIFAFTLDHELEIYRAMGRIDKAQLIIKDFIEKFK